MSRKKVRKDVVKRKMNIYDPMGVYSRGPTRNQRLGMVRQIKAEYLGNPKPVITQKLLAEYKEVLKFYGIPTVPLPLEGMGTVTIPFDIENNSLTISNTKVLAYLAEHDVTPVGFICTSFIISKDESVYEWDTGLFYSINVGGSAFIAQSSDGHYVSETRDDDLIVGPYYMDGSIVYYNAIKYDSSKVDTYVRQETFDISQSPEEYADFNVLPHDGTVIPYLLYPNNHREQLTLSIGTDPTGDLDNYHVILKVLVIR